MKIPDTDSVRELAEFWDTHDVTSFEDQLEVVSKPVFVARPDGVTVTLTADERSAVRKIAASRGVEEADLIREWVRDKLHR